MKPGGLLNKESHFLLRFFFQMPAHVLHSHIISSNYFTKHTHAHTFVGLFARAIASHVT